MSIRFFRKHEKLIPIVMIALMVAFLVGYKGFEMLTRSGREDQLIGKARDFKIHASDLVQAKGEIDIIRRIAENYRTGSYGFADRLIRIPVNPYQFKPAKHPYITYAILNKLADEAGIEALDVEVDIEINTFNAETTPGVRNFKRFVADMRENSVTEKQIRGAIKNWLKVTRFISTREAVIPANLALLRAEYKMFNEKIAGEAIEINTDDYLAKAPKTFKDEAIQKQFDEFRDILPGDKSSLDSFGFGYKVPAKTSVVGLSINWLVLRGAIAPTADQIERYKESNAQMLYTPGAAKSTDEVNKKIVDALKSQMFTEYKTQLENDFNTLASLPGKFPAKIYQGKLDSYTLPADSILKRKIAVINIDNKPLTEAITMLEKAVNNEIVIAFPTGKLGDADISGDIKISLIETDITLGQALENIKASIKDMPEFKWVRLKGCRSGLFAKGKDVNNLPIRMVEFKNVDRKEMQSEIRKNQLNSVPGTLVAASFKDLKGKEAKPLIAQYGQYLISTFFWRQIAFSPEKAPEKITAELKKQIIKDLRTAKAFELALADAKKIATAKQFEAKVAAMIAEKRAADDAAEKKAKPEAEKKADAKAKKGPAGQDAAKKATEAKKAPEAEKKSDAVTPKTEVLTEKQKQAIERNTIAEYRSKLLLSLDLQARKRRVSATQYQQARVEDVLPIALDGFDHATQLKVRNSLFSLAPAADNTQYTKTSTKTAVCGVKSAKRIFIIIRTNYEPALESSFLKSLGSLFETQAKNSVPLGDWLSYDFVSKRAGFVLEANEDEEQDKKEDAAGEEKPAKSDDKSADKKADNKKSKK